MFQRRVRFTCNAMKLQCAFKDLPEISVRNKSKLPTLTASVGAYSFSCLCGICHIGRLTQQSYISIEEHPHWPNQGASETISGTILAHLLPCNTVTLFIVTQITCIRDLIALSHLSMMLSGPTSFYITHLHTHPLSIHTHKSAHQRHCCNYSIHWVHVL